MNELLRAVQRVARSVVAVRMPLERIAELVHREIAMPQDEIARQLRCVETRGELSRNYETELWLHANKQYCLVCTALPDNQKDAETLVTHSLNYVRNGCMFCKLQENTWAGVELVEAKSPVGMAIQCELVHPRCALFWQRLKLIADGR